MTIFKRILTALLVLALVLSTAPVVFAAEVSANDVYVLKRTKTNYTTGESTGPNMQFESLYQLEYNWNGEFAGKPYPAIYSMLDPDGEIIPTYCLDIKVAASGGTSYRRLNLEDSAYSASVAGRIRAIITYGFYVSPQNYTTYADYENALYAKIDALGTAAGVSNLTLCEALSATQCAIWQVAHGSVLSFGTFVRSTIYKPIESAVEYHELCLREKKDLFPDRVSAATLSEADIENINNNIRTVYNYLCALPSIESTKKVVSPSSFTHLNDPVLTRNEDGTYDVSVTTTVYVEMAAGDDLTLKATLGSKTASQALYNGSQTVTLTFSGISEEQAKQDVTLSISGHQTSSGIFLFDANGNRNASQTMVGMDNSRLPVYAEVVAQEERIISITKTTSSYAPLEGIIFDIYRAASLEDYLDGKFSIENPPTRTDLAEYTLITNANGKAALNLTQFGLEDGVYLLVERDHPAIVQPIDPFYVIVPSTNKEGTGYDYNIQIYPKNDVKGAVKIEKDVQKLNNDEAPVDAYADHTWIITTSIPDDITHSKSYVISDTLDSRLDYIGNMAVTVETTDGATIVATLDPDTDYLLNVTDVDSLAEGHPSDSFTLSLTPGGLAAVTTALGTNSTSDYRIRIRFDAQVNANTQMGEMIPNKASITYVNSVNITFLVYSDVPVVYTGGANLRKVDKEDHTILLPGATFQLYRRATVEELATNTEALTTVFDRDGSMIQVSFFDNPDLTGPKVNSITSGADGKIAIYGLAPGIYYLVETQAPAGYNLMGSSLALTIDSITHLDQQTVDVENARGAMLPETGGSGIQIHILTGVVLMTLSLLLILRKKRHFT